MLKNFALWFICFGLSFLVENFGWAEQGQAFLYIELGTIGLIFAVVVLICLLGRSGFVIPMALVIFYAIIVGIALFATWGATKLFNVDFFVAYQIMRFGQCFCSSSSNEDY